MKLELSRGILKNFAQITNDRSNNKTSTSVHATAVVVDGVKYAKIDGSNVLTPISETTDVQTGDRILVTIENHKAVVIGNFTYPPSARNEQKALEESERASSTANSAIEKAGQAQSLASEANTLSSQANTAANQAVASAQQASTLAQNAQSAASEANTKSDSALASASESLTKSNAAQQELDALKAEVEIVQGDVADAREEAIVSVNEIKEELSVNYAKKTEVTAVEGSLKAELTKSVAELQTTISEQYTAKSDSVALEERLQSQITQNADNISSVVSRTTRLETDTSEAQKQIDAAKADAAKAQSAADAAQAAAKTAKDSADAAQSAANTAQENATAAQTTADAAKAKAEAANIAAANAQTDLDNAKANLNEVTNRVGATEEEIAAAQQAVDDAQAAADQAIANAASANSAAATAQSAADKAKADAANAQSAADSAQTKADSASAAAATAQAAADKAQADADALKSRVTSCETRIDQNAEAITLRATKTELTNAVDGIQIGGRNLLRGSKDFSSKYFTYDSSGSSAIGTGVINSDGSMLVTNTNSNYRPCYIYRFDVKPDVYYTISIKYKHISGVETFQFQVEGLSDSLGVLEIYDGTTDLQYRSLPNGWKLVYRTFKFTNANVSKFQIFFRSGRDHDLYTHSYYIKEPMLEQSTKPSEWIPAPEDQDDATQAVADNLANNYYTKVQTDAAIQVKADSITSTVSSTYATKSENQSTLSVANAAQSTANTANASASNAQKSADNVATNLANNYSTTVQMNSAIEQKADSIISSVSATYQTKDDMGNYSTTAQMNSAISQSANSIKSEVSQTYATNAKVDGIQIGGRNLLLKTSQMPGVFGTDASGCAYKGTVVYQSDGSALVTNNNSNFRFMGPSFVVTAGEVYTFSAYYKEVSGTQNHRFYIDYPGTSGETFGIGTKENIGNGWIRYYFTFTIPSGKTSIRVWLGSGSDYTAYTHSYYIKKPKLEKGNKPTDWIPAPEDVDASIGEVKTIADQTADKFTWIVKSGTSATNFTLTDRTATLIAETISLNGNVKVNGNMLVSGTVTADKISVTSLEAICAKIGGFTIGSSALYNNTTALAGAANSVYLGTDGISCGTTFKVTKAGDVTATSGKIGKYDITSTYLMTGSGSTATGIGGNQAFWAGNSDSNSAPFRVSYKGQLYAKDMIASNQLYIYDEKNSTTMPFAYADGGVIFNGVAYAFNGTVTFNNGFILDNDSSISGHVIPSISNTYNIGGANNEFNYTCSRIVRIGLADYSESKAVIDTKWKDGNTHNILTRGTDGLTSAIGWVGSASYATVLKLNSRTVQVVNSSGTSTLSDGRLKKDFRNLDAWEQFYLDLEPIAYKYKDGSSGRNHMGFVAQQVEDALLNNGLTTNDFAGLVKYDVNPDDEDGWHGYKTEYGLIYTEFTALNTYMTQKNAKAVKELSHRFTVLDGKVNSTYARMASAEERIDKLEKENIELKEENKQMREEIARLKMAS